MFKLPFWLTGVFLILHSIFFMSLYVLCGALMLPLCARYFAVDYHMQTFYITWGILAVIFSFFMTAGIRIHEHEKKENETWKQEN